MLTFILCVVCTPHYFKNPYLVSKLIEILFVINPAVQERTQDLNIRMMTNQISADYLPSALMNFYTGKPYIYFFEFPFYFLSKYIELKSGVTIELPLEGLKNSMVFWWTYLFRIFIVFQLLLEYQKNLLIFFYKGSIYCFPTSTTLISGLILSYRWGKAPFA